MRASLAYIAYTEAVSWYLPMLRKSKCAHSFSKEQSCLKQQLFVFLHLLGWWPLLSKDTMIAEQQPGSSCGICSGERASFVTKVQNQSGNFGRGAQAIVFLSVGFRSPSWKLTTWDLNQKQIFSTTLDG
jgi:hypothetical protein